MKPIIYKDQKVITTDLLAQAYETDVKNIRMNFSNNKDRFLESRHYFKLEGEELRAFKRETNHIGFVAPNVNFLYLWTERGANRHSKILDTDKAWEQFENLEETYFRVKEAQTYAIHPVDTPRFGEAAAYLRVVIRNMKEMNCSPVEVARVIVAVSAQAGIRLPDNYVKENPWEQVKLNLPIAQPCLYLPQ